MARLSKVSRLGPLPEAAEGAESEYGINNAEFSEKRLSQSASKDSLRRPKYTVEISSSGAKAGDRGSGERFHEVPPTYHRRRPTTTYKLYKRRWLGLLQLALLNLIFGWNWLTFPSISSNTQTYFQVSPTAITGLSMAFIGALCLLSPAVTWIIHKAGTRAAFIISGLMLLFGSWIRYLGTEGSSFGVVLFANVIFGAGASFALILPTHYSDLWFSPAGRMGATAVASLAYPTGILAGQLVSPHLGLLPWVVLWSSIISTSLSLGTVFVPGEPPSQASASRSITKVPLGIAFVRLIQSKEFWLLSIPVSQAATQELLRKIRASMAYTMTQLQFATYVGLFNSMASLLYKIFCPYASDPNFAGICGAVCISSGLIATLILYPFIAKTRSSLITLKVLTPIIGLCYLIFIWISDVQQQAATLIVIAVLGGATFILIPTTLEYLVDSLHPIAPESTSSLCWAAGELLGIVFISVMDILNAGDESVPPKHMKSGLIFQAVVALVVVPLPFCLGIFERPLASKDNDPRAVAQIPISHEDSDPFV